MSTSLTVVGVTQPAPSRERGIVLTPVYLPVVTPQTNWWNSVRPSSQDRGDAFSGSFQDDSYGSNYNGSAIYLPSLASLVDGARAAIAQYVSWQALSPMSGQMVNYYA